MTYEELIEYSMEWSKDKDFYQGVDERIEEVTEMANDMLDELKKLRKLKMERTKGIELSMTEKQINEAASLFFNRFSSCFVQNYLATKQIDISDTIELALTDEQFQVYDLMTFPWRRNFINEQWKKISEVIEKRMKTLENFKSEEEKNENSSRFKR